MSETQEDADPPVALPEPVTEHEVLFGREHTSGYLMAEAVDRDDVVEGCAERTAEEKPQAPSQEQQKPVRSIRL